jgi:hypothetical protein
MNIFAAIVIAFCALGSTLLVEFISWAMIYRTDSYKALKEEVERTTRKLERRKKETSATAAKRATGLEETLKATNQKMQVARLKSMLVVGVVMFVVVTTLNSHFEGVVIVKLPFRPFGMLQGITHRNLAGDDFTDGSCTFVYALASMALRPLVQRYVGEKPPEGMQPPSLFAPPKM